jgi:hypothetical protein
MSTCPKCDIESELAEIPEKLEANATEARKTYAYTVGRLECLLRSLLERDLVLCNRHRVQRRRSST